MRRNAAEVALSLGVLALGLGIAGVTATLPSEGGYAGIGPNFIPGVVAAGIVVLGLWLSFEAFSERCHTHVRFLLDWMPYFETPFEVPIDPQTTYIEDDEIKRQFADVLARLMADRTDASLRFIPKLAYQA